MGRKAKYSAEVKINDVKEYLDGKNSIAIISKKIRRNREEAGLSLLRYNQIYQIIKEENEMHGYPISALCKLGEVSRAAYYKWLNREIPENEVKNNLIADEIKKIHAESPDKGYHRKS